METAVAFLLAFSLATCLPLAAVTKTIKCHGDICNRGTDNQFCSTYFQMCRSCSDIVLDCGTDIQPPECTPYCMTYAVQLELKKTKANSCMLYKTITNGFVSPYQNESGHVAINTTVTFSCETGFELQGAKTKTCLGDNEWTEKDDPFCVSQKYKVWMDIGIVLAAITITLTIVIVVLIIVMYRLLHQRRSKGNQRFQKNESDSPNKRISASESGIDLTCQDEDSPLVNTADTTAQQQNITVVKRSTTPENPNDNTPNKEAENQPSTTGLLAPSLDSSPQNHSQSVGSNIVNVSLHVNNEQKGSNRNHIPDTQTHVASESKTNPERGERIHRQISATRTDPAEESQETFVARQETNKDATGKGIMIDLSTRILGRPTDRACIPTGK